MLTQKKRKARLALLCVLSAVLLSLPWYEHFSGVILFVAFIPLLFVEDLIYTKPEYYKRSSIIWFAGLTFFLWPSICGWWVKNASFVGMLFINTTNTILIVLTFWLFHITKKRLGPRIGNFSLIVYWITFEYFFLNAEISFPWLVLGNGFAKDVRLIQWYEYTGALGGSLWILIINLLLYSLFKHYIKYRTFKRKLIASVLAFLIIAIPIVISLIRYSTYKETGKSVNIIAVQPNVDPYEKFQTYTNEEQVRLVLDNAIKLLDKNVDYIVAPETAVTNYADIHYLNEDRHLKRIKEFITPYPKLKMILGIFMRQYYSPEDDISPTASPYGNSGYYYDTYNSAIQIDSTDSIQYYHKSLLVVGVEKMPYPHSLRFLKKLTLKLGGTFRSLATQEERSNLVAPDNSSSVAPVICWENIYGEYVTKYIQKGATIIFVITNEGWWGNTPGHVTLNHYSRLRAIETRRSVTRSANTGITSFINQRGDVLKSIGWWKEGAIKGILHTNDKITFYTKHGDYIGRISRIFAFLVALMAIVNFLISKKTKQITPLFK